MLEYAARRSKPVMIYVFSDGSLASRRHDRQFGRRARQGRVDGRQLQCRRHLFPGVTTRRASRSRRRTTRRLSLQLGYFNPDGSVNTTGSPAGNNVFNLVQTVVLNYMALHGTQANFSTLYPAPNLNNTLGGAAAQDVLTAFQPLAGLVNGKIA